LIVKQLNLRKTSVIKMIADFRKEVPVAPANDTPGVRTDPRTELVVAVSAELGELRQAADRLDEAVASLYGLNRTDLRCLGILYRRGRVTAGELADESGLTPGAITTALDRLEKSGYANRVADPEDRRRVLVLSTVAAREVGARIYGEVEVATQRVLEGCSAEELTAIRDYLRGAREVYEGQIGHIVACLAGPAETAGTGQAPESWAPLAGATAARLEFTKGASKVTIRADAALADLYRARFEGPSPNVLVRGNTVTIEQKRRFHPFDWRSQSSDLSLNTSVSWAVSLRGGMWKLSADLRTLRLDSLEVTGGASDVEIWLPPAIGLVPVRLSGGASKISLHRRAGTAIRVVMSGGASQLIFDDNRLGAIGGRNHLESPGFSEAADRYEVRISGGASQIVIDAA
jgi:DNA-binding MarR family transcriptional regulator